MALLLLSSNDCYDFGSVMSWYSGPGAVKTQDEDEQEKQNARGAKSWREVVLCCCCCDALQSRWHPSPSLPLHVMRTDGCRNLVKAIVCVRHHLFSLHGAGMQSAASAALCMCAC